jgi:hypothetical protein
VLRRTVRPLRNNKVWRKLRSTTWNVLRRTREEYKIWLWKLRGRDHLGAEKDERVILIWILGKFFEDFNCFELTQNKVRRQVFVVRVMNSLVP